MQPIKVSHHDMNRELKAIDKLELQEWSEVAGNLVFCRAGHMRRYGTLDRDVDRSWTAIDWHQSHAVLSRKEAATEIVKLHFVPQDSVLVKPVEGFTREEFADDSGSTKSNLTNAGDG
jgi:hypothetical protein